MPNSTEHTAIQSSEPIGDEKILQEHVETPKHEDSPAPVPADGFELSEKPKLNLQMVLAFLVRHPSLNMRFY
jgi:hypothetical protein